MIHKLITLPLFLLSVFILNSCSGPELIKSNTSKSISEIHVIPLSEELLYYTRTNNPNADLLVNNLKKISSVELVKQLPYDAKRKAFWLNIYNTFVQRELAAHPEKYKSRNTFFTTKFIEIAGIKFSLDDIEHGILRKSPTKYGLGFIPKLYSNSIEKKLRVDVLDPRIHFALNCGAKSCPPIRYYDWKILDDQLHIATKSYIESEFRYDTINETIYLPKVIGWFRGDFGGMHNLPIFLKSHSIIPNKISIYQIKFNDYDWKMQLYNYK